MCDDTINVSVHCMAIAVISCQTDPASSQSADIITAALPPSKSLVLELLAHPIKENFTDFV